jgi:hypothetical protein
MSTRPEKWDMHDPAPLDLDRLKIALANEDRLRVSSLGHRRNEFFTEHPDSPGLLIFSTRHLLDRDVASSLRGSLQEANVRLINYSLEKLVETPGQGTDPLVVTEGLEVPSPTDIVALPSAEFHATRSPEQQRIYPMGIGFIALSSETSAFTIGYLDPHSGKGMRAQIDPTEIEPLYEPRVVTEVESHVIDIPRYDVDELRRERQQA